MTNHADLNELVFSGRNKAYGAYVLRTTYHFTVVKSLFIMISAITMLTIIAWQLAERPQPAADAGGQLKIPETLTVTVNNSPEPPPPAPQKKPAPLPSANNNSRNESLIIRESYDLNDTLPAEESFSDSTAAEVPSGADGTGLDADNNTQGSNTSTFMPDTIMQDFQLEEQPEFPGGIKALRELLAANLRYPREEAEMGISGTVLVAFVVDQQGRISDVKVKVPASPAFDREAISVIKLLPDFKSPGRIAGQAVKVHYTLPIRFKLR